MQFEHIIGFINGITSLKQLLVPGGGQYKPLLCEVTDYSCCPTGGVVRSDVWSQIKADICGMECASR